jgi:hypothetical protein
MPITEFLSRTDLIEDFDCFSYQQKHQLRPHVTGLIASGNILKDRGIDRHLVN